MWIYDISFRKKCWKKPVRAVKHMITSRVHADTCAIIASEQVGVGASGQLQGERHTTTVGKDCPVLLPKDV